MNTDPDGQAVPTAEPLPHPAACPYCGGVAVNQAVPKYMLRDAILTTDGSITLGDAEDGADSSGPSLLFCHGCSSTYVQPAGITEHYVRTVDGGYPERPPTPGEPGYVGMGVAWTAVPVAGTHYSAVGHG